jgi:hypothetical protein
MRRRLRRRLFWAGALYGLALLYIVASAIRAGLRVREIVAGRERLATQWKGVLR